MGQSSRPPFEATPAVLMEIDRISRLLGRWEGLGARPPKPAISRANRIRAIRSTLAIEGSTLSLDQVTAVLDGRRVAGPAREIREALNAARAYEAAPSIDPRSMRDFLRAHGIMMEGLVEGAGRLRTRDVGVAAGRRVRHVAPHAHQVERLVRELFGFLKGEREAHPMVKACVFHYEIEFVHPFEDGNGRMGRLWQHALCLGLHQAFAHVPVESVVHERRDRYYEALAAADSAGSSTPFVEFSLAAIGDALGTFLEDLEVRPLDADARLAIARERLGTAGFTRGEYVRLVKGISTATASRDLAHGVETGGLVRTGVRALARYRFA